MKSDLQQMLDVLSEGIVLFDKRGELSYINEAACGIFERVCGERLPSRVVLDLIAQARQGTLDLPCTIDLEENSAQCNIACDLIALKNGYYVVVRDQTEVHRHSSFVSNILTLINHELRTPMSTFVGAAQLIDSLLSDGTGLDKVEMAKLTELAIRSSRKLSHKMERLLGLAALHSDEPIVGDQRLNVGQLAIDAYDEVFLAAQEKRVNINLEGFDDQLGVIYGSQTWLGKAIVECLVNAVEHSHQGAQIAFTARQQGNFVQLVIKDQGKGVTAKTGQNIFDTFNTGDKPATLTERGLGIGLSLCRRIIELHGGNIKLTHENEPGAEFVIELPTGSPHRPAQGMDASQAQYYARDLALLMRSLHEKDGALSHAGSTPSR